MKAVLDALVILIVLSTVVWIIYRKKRADSKKKFHIAPILHSDPFEKTVGNSLKKDAHEQTDDTFSSLGFGALETFLTEQPPQIERMPDLPNPPQTPTPLKKHIPHPSSGQEAHLVLYVFGKEERSFIGYELLQSILSAGMRFGEMNIFHRFEHLNAQGKILFSLASATEPGTFDITTMGACSCRGLALFIRLKENTNPAANFELMLGTARQLAQDLDGEIIDDQHQPLTQTRIKAYREEIRRLTETFVE